MVQEAGWNINREASKVLFVTYMEPLMYLIPDFKINKLLRMIVDVLEKKEKSARITGEQMVGTLVAASMAFWPASRILLRSIQDLVYTNTEEFTNMGEKCYLSDRAGKNNSCYTIVF